MWFIVFISYITGLKYAIEGIEKLDMFIIKMPRRANPLNMSIESILWFIAKSIYSLRKSPPNVGLKIT